MEELTFSENLKSLPPHDKIIQERYPLLTTFSRAAFDFDKTAKR
jgi:hypothetical protein